MKWRWFQRAGLGEAGLGRELQRAAPCAGWGPVLVKGNLWVVGPVWREHPSPVSFVFRRGQLVVVGAEGQGDVLQQQQGLWFLPGTLTQTWCLDLILQTWTTAFFFDTSTELFWAKWCSWTCRSLFFSSLWGSTWCFASWFCKRTLAKMLLGGHTLSGTGCVAGLVQFGPRLSSSTKKAATLVLPLLQSLFVLLHKSQNRDCLLLTISELL